MSTASSRPSPSPHVGHAGPCKLRSGPAILRVSRLRSTVISIPAPALIEQSDFDRVQAKLDRNRPRLAPPGVNEQSCTAEGHRGRCLLRFGKHPRGIDRSVGPLSFIVFRAGCQQTGKTVCKANHILAATAPDRFSEVASGALCRKERVRRPPSASFFREDRI
jgi:hypothetical protein